MTLTSLISEKIVKVNKDLLQKKKPVILVERLKKWRFHFTIWMIWLKQVRNNNHEYSESKESSLKVYYSTITINKK